MEEDLHLTKRVIGFIKVNGKMVNGMVRVMVDFVLVLNMVVCV